MNPTPLVIDKSFAQAMKCTRLSELSKERTLLAPRAFHYETLTTAQGKMFSTLVGLDDFRWVDKEMLLRSERDNGEACCKAELVRFCVDRDYLTPSWRPSNEEKEAAEQYRVESVEPFLDLWDEIMKEDPIGFTSLELAATTKPDSDFINLCNFLRDPERIRIIAKELNFRHSEKLNAAWFSFRFIQVFALQSLVLRRRYPGVNPEFSRKRLEHDFHDMDYLALGLHVGSLATNDISPKLNKASIGWRFKLLEPSFSLVTPKDTLISQPLTDP